MIKIKDIKAREILDSRGNPTVEVELITENGLFLASVPSGASVGRYEAKEIRDGEDRYRGKGVLEAIRNIEKTITPNLKDIEINSQRQVDEILISIDGTKDKSNLGANAILPISMAICRALASAKNTPLYRYIDEIYETAFKGEVLKLPTPCFNIINGGSHAGNNLDFQEFMIIPQLESFSLNLQAGSEIYHNLKDVLKKDFGKDAINVGDEGGFAPNLNLAEEALDLTIRAIGISGYRDRVNIALDVAASEFYKNGKYGMRSRDEMIQYYLELID